MKQELKLQHQLNDDAPDVSVMHCVRHSLASQPIMATFTFDKNPTAPTFVRLRCDDSDGPAAPPLLVFTLPAAPAAHVSYRAIIVPSMLWNSHLEDEQFLIERANPAVYAKLDFSLISGAKNKGIEPIIEHITERFAADLNFLLPAGDQGSVKKAAHQTVKHALDKLNADDFSRTALVYYSSVQAQPASSSHQVETSILVQSDYLDMYGGLINLSNDSYRIGVLAWLDDPESTTTSTRVSSLVAESKPIGVRTFYYEGSGPDDTIPAAAPSPHAA